MNAALKLGSRIRFLRDLRRLTQDELAEKSSTSPQYISALERGLKNVTLEMLEKISDGLGVELILLFAFDSDSERLTKANIKKLVDQLQDDDIEKVGKLISIISKRN
jgi:transcriptional regulator with XRE-family HTH domain